MAHACERFGVPAPAVSAFGRSMPCSMAVTSAGLRRLAERQRLSYEVETGYGSIQAVNLKALDTRRVPSREG
jgi:hypothetical protein